MFALARFFTLLIVTFTPVTMASTAFSSVEREHSKHIASAQIEQILVKKSQRKMFLLSEGKVLKAFPVSLGKQNKKQPIQNNHTTPEGHFVISAKTLSTQYHKAIHLATLPAESESSASVTLMIHGSPNHYQFDENFLLEFDWTNGAIAVSNNVLDQLWLLVDKGTPINIQP